MVLLILFESVFELPSRYPFHDVIFCTENIHNIFPELFGLFWLLNQIKDGLFGSKSLLFGLDLGRFDIIIFLIFLLVLILRSYLLFLRYWGLLFLTFILIITGVIDFPLAVHVMKTIIAIF
jgi:hypothetical protein